MTSYITKKGLKDLQEELEERKMVTRKTIAQAIKEAKEQGDLSENAEYAEAKRQQRENEGRIIKLENIIRTSTIISKKKNEGVVEIGSVVEVESKKARMTLYIVGSNEADPSSGKISNESPIGQAFLGKKEGEKFDVKLPNGKKMGYKVRSVK
jgi:transcription elongation factor GreA